MQGKPSAVCLDALDAFGVFGVGDKSAPDAGSVCIQIFADKSFAKEGDCARDGESQVDVSRPSRNILGVARCVQVDFFLSVMARNAQTSLLVFHPQRKRNADAALESRNVGVGTGFRGRGGVIRLVFTNGADNSSCNIHRTFTNGDFLGESQLSPTKACVAGVIENACVKRRGYQRRNHVPSLTAQNREACLAERNFTVAVAETRVRIVG